MATSKRKGRRGSLSGPFFSAGECFLNLETGRIEQQQLVAFATFGARRHFRPPVSLCTASAVFLKLAASCNTRSVSILEF
jgi:hypothetical protein